MISLLGLDPATYRPHPLHDDERTYTETNCYADCMIELVAASGWEPEAMFAGAVEVDYELDQWTFFKPPADDLRRLYGIETHEMQPYRSLPHQVAERLAAGQTLLPELDSWWLPDTAATSYRTEHVKTSVVAEAIDLDAKVFRYFHNAGYHELSGEDFDGVFAAATSAAMPPYVDLVRFDAGAPLVGEAARAEALALLREHLGRRSRGNPFEAFRARLEADLPGLLEGDLADYHAYAFANARMAGASFELLASHVRWLAGGDGEPAAAALDDVVGGTKMLLFRLARRRAFDVAGVVGPMAERWQAAIDHLDALAG
ncbi:DUF1839 family protein [Nocardioides sp. SYSU D00038]|uniref:DUF1839 family protein n=1 Tax=Nocardioides sp. SYSU D00038 TaxID=2812554 RepID=UPI001968454B|nr:DUF1839 family protein [Nocardioides sp. SYSU D00038]